MDDKWVSNIKCKIQKLNLFFKLTDEKHDKIKETAILTYHGVQAVVYSH